MKYQKALLFCFIALIITASILMLMPSPPDIYKDIQNIDKIEHAAVFFVLAFFLCLLLRKVMPGRIRKLLLVFGCLMLYGILIEIIQPFTGRNLEVADMAAEAVGVLSGTAVSFIFCD